MILRSSVARITAVCCACLLWSLASRGASAQKARTVMTNHLQDIMLAKKVRGDSIQMAKLIAKPFPVDAQQRARSIAHGLQVDSPTRASIEAVTPLPSKARSFQVPSQWVKPSSVAYYENQKNANIATARTNVDFIRVSRRVLDQSLGGVEKDTLKVMRDGAIEVLPHDSMDVDLKPGEYVFKKTGDEATVTSQSDPSGHVEALNFSPPYRWFSIDSLGVAHAYGPVVRLEGQGLRATHLPGLFSGTAFIGIEDSLHAHDGRRTLDPPIRLLVTATRGGRIEGNEQMEVDHTRLMYQVVTVTAPESANIRIETDADPEGVYLPLPVFRRRIRLQIQPGSVEAMGLSAATISVMPQEGFAENDTVTVHLVAPSGSLPEPTLRVYPGSRIVTRFRADGLGPHVITALIDGLPVETATVDSRPPWRFATAALLGGGLGGSIVLFGKRRRPKSIWRVLGPALGAGLVLALIQRLTTGLGPKMDDPSSYAAVLLVAAVGGFGGRAMLERLTASWVPGKDA